jgi:hypothetical protein
MHSANNIIKLGSYVLETQTPILRLGDYEAELLGDGCSLIYKRVVGVVKLHLRTGLPED